MAHKNAGCNQTIPFCQEIDLRSGLSRKNFEAIRLTFSAFGISQHSINSIAFFLAEVCAFLLSTQYFTFFAGQTVKTKFLSENLKSWPQNVPSHPGSMGRLGTATAVASLGMQHSVIHGAEMYGLGLQEKLLSEHLSELKYSCHLVGKVQI